MELTILPTLPGPGENSPNASEPGNLSEMLSQTSLKAPPPPKEMGHPYSKGSGHFPQPQGKRAETKTGWVPTANSSLSQQRFSVRVLLSQMKSQRFQVVSQSQTEHAGA